MIFQKKKCIVLWPFFVFLTADKLVDLRESNGARLANKQSGYFVFPVIFFFLRTILIFNFLSFGESKGKRGAELFVCFFFFFFFFFFFEEGRGIVVFILMGSKLEQKKGCAHRRARLFLTHPNQTRKERKTFPYKNLNNWSATNQLYIGNC